MACMIFSPDGSDILGAPGYKRTAGEGMKQKEVDVLQQKKYDYPGILEMYLSISLI
jgi:hypothetical protein